MNKDELSFELAPEEPDARVEGFPSDAGPERKPSGLQLEFEQASNESEEEATPNVPNMNSALAADNEPSPFKSSPASPFANGTGDVVRPHVEPPITNSVLSGQQTEVKKAEEPKIIIYEKNKSGLPISLLITLAIFGVIGAVLAAGTAAFYFSLGRRVGFLFIIFLAAFGARMGTALDASSARWYAAWTAGASAVASKAFLVLILFQLSPQFSAEDWTAFRYPGKANAMYLQQSIDNAFTAGISDSRSGQEKLDERFNKEFSGDDSEEYVTDEPKILSFGEVFPRLFDLPDFILTLLAMLGAFKFANNEG